ncbi:MAG: SDR family NAD(P)-dependent oxidoreductase [Proteobacteria bacterium]|nr:SDR family NAD(P)-dependent oxidoreductase [Pseudomonadota bacterium]
MSGRVCVVAGVGPGTGTAICERFAAAGDRVAMLARTAERLEALAERIPGARGYPVDIGDRGAVADAFDAIRADLGPVEVYVHNAAAGAFNHFMEVKPETLELTFRVNVMSLLHCGQQAAADMLKQGAGHIVVTGNTSAWRGKANFAAFAPTKAAQRILAQSMARSLGPQGVHVAYVVIDAVIDVPWTRKAFADRPDEYFAQPSAIADTVHFLTRQERSAWSFEVDLRPYGESW